MWIKYLQFRLGKHARHATERHVDSGDSRGWHFFFCWLPCVGPAKQPYQTKYKLELKHDADIHQLCVCAVFQFILLTLSVVRSLTLSVSLSLSLCVASAPCVKCRASAKVFIACWQCSTMAAHSASLLTPGHDNRPIKTRCNNCCFSVPFYS